MADTLLPGNVWTYVDGVLTQVPDATIARPTAKPLQVNKQPVLVGMIELTIAGDQVTATGMASKLGRATATKKGVYRILFDTPQPDKDYMVFPQASGFTVDVTSRTPEYFEITVSGRSSGKEESPPTVQLSVQRIQ